MFVVQRDKVEKIRPWKDGSGWFVYLAEGYFYALVVILFEEKAHIAEATWTGIGKAPMPTYVRVETESA